MHVRIHADALDRSTSNSTRMKNAIYPSAEPNCHGLRVRRLRLHYCTRGAVFNCRFHHARIARNWNATWWLAWRSLDNIGPTKFGVWNRFRLRESPFGNRDTDSSPEMTDNHVMVRSVGGRRSEVDSKLPTPAHHYRSPTQMRITTGRVVSNSVPNLAADSCDCDSQQGSRSPVRNDDRLGPHDCWRPTQSCD